MTTFPHVSSNTTREETDLRETIAAWTRYIDRLSRDAGQDQQLQQLITSARLRRGIAFAHIKAWDAAQADLQWIIDEQHGKDEERSACLVLGAVYAEHGQDDEAIVCWSTVLSAWEQATRKEARAFEEDIPLLYLYRGMLHGRQKRYRDAIADGDRAITLQPDSAEAFSVRGISYSYLGELDQALADCTHAVELDPQARHSHRLSEVHMMRHEYRLALDVCNRAHELDPTDEYVLISRNKARFMLMMSLFEGHDQKPEEQIGDEQIEQDHAV